MPAPRWWPRLVLVALVLMVIGALDPLEGAVVIAAGVLLLAMAGAALRSPIRRRAYAAGILVVVGVAALHTLSALGGVGGSTGRSTCWLLLAAPYPLGWGLGWSRRCACAERPRGIVRAMVLTKTELIASLQHEVRVLLHLAGKIEPASIDYRPTPKQRSTLELLQYLSVMGPAFVQAIKAGQFDGAAWGAAMQAASGRTLQETVQVIAGHADAYAALLADVSDEDLRADIELFSGRMSRGAYLVNMVLSGCAAYRTQLFCYLKACGRDELGTANLWRGMDMPPTA
jgi:hypothetical protein